MFNIGCFLLMNKRQLRQGIDHVQGVCQKNTGSGNKNMSTIIEKGHINAYKISNLSDVRAEIPGQLNSNSKELFWIIVNPVEATYV